MSNITAAANAKVVILCGGLGTRLREETEHRPKPMVEVGGRPLLWHIMKIYSAYGFRDFVLSLGYKGEMIKNYFANYEILNNDITVDLGARHLTVHRKPDEHDWRITLVDTGQRTQTGARIKRVAPYLDSDLFLVTYGDGVTDLDISKVVDFHRAHGKIGTVTGVSPPSRYGELHIAGERVLGFNEKPQKGESFINGGYFVFNRAFLDYLDDDEECVLERKPLERLADAGELMVYNHPGFWQCMDTHRDFEYLQGLWQSKEARWKVW